MQYAKLNENGSYTIGDLSALHPNTSFPDIGPGVEWMVENNTYPVDNILVYDAYAYRRVEIEPTLKERTVYTAELVPHTQEELAVFEEQRKESRKSEIRELRNRMLQSTDWTQLSDASGDKQAWATFRQGLRDITKQEGFPDAVQWPRSPLEVDPPVVAPTPISEPVVVSETPAQPAPEPTPVLPSGNVTL